MRVRSGLFERRPLPHAEAVLFVDHDQAQLGETYVFLQDRMRADDEVDAAGGDFFQHSRPHIGRQAADQLRAADLAAGQKAAERQGMLPGEDFRGGHEHGLMPMGDGQKHGIEGHDRLAAADVALQEAVHGPCRAMSAAMSAIACCCPAVSSNGNRRRMRASILRGCLQRRGLAEVMLLVSL